ncbi:(2E,6E)-farnesyl diphosphate synthase [Betaproteobacteria bacterium]|nr:(2E,6E)-farnesyl diphosphate synthase [Betaproteobacteria bacterium]GHT99541.1 (2E,6E)-farnesyl diphosphate synthase [Betaproteobacteria bacterium]GHU11607.1 (2E,6E)-farnesyl diphosphate synthase [Betaproteobacteria bacterium]GHU22541.1 (2E,6E)-farnesyl diphosphate synthase [Betaproteobacteria bacterium]
MSAPTVPPFTEWMRRIQERTESALDRILPAANIAPTRLHEAMRYAVLGGGKRVRALLVHAAGELVAAAPTRLDAGASAVELIHAYSLVHDDMPCMDNDVLRRGKPTVHVEYDEATALLVGDALQTLAFQALADPPGDAAGGQIELIRLLASASGSRGMAGGQAIDIAAVGQHMSREALEFMHVHKTGALIRAAALIGVRSGASSSTDTSDTFERVDHYARRVGLLFQVVDDILDAEADTATLGKTAGKDAEHDKPTYVSLLGLADARRFAEGLLADAHAALAPLDKSSVRLLELADYIAHRAF